MNNPFVFGGKITDPKQFIGREKELKRIFDFLDATHTGQIQHVSVVGDRRIGKSSLLYHIKQTYEKRLPDPQNYRFLYLDLDRPNCHTQHDFLRYVLKQLDFPALGEQSLSLTQFYELIEQKHEKSNLWPVFLMDEFEHLSHRPDEFPDAFYETLRSLGNNNLISIITASQRPLKDLAKQKKLTSPFFNIFHQIDFGKFTKAEANALLNRGKASDRPFSDDDCRQILKIAGNYPARLQLVARRTYEEKTNADFVDWKAIKIEVNKTPAFQLNSIKNRTKISRVAHWSKRGFITFQQVMGRFVLELIGREKTTDTTALICGVIVSFLIIGLLFGLLHWDTFIKYVQKFSK